MNNTPPPVSRADFLDEAGYQAYLKAEAKGLVRLHAPARHPEEFGSHPLPPAQRSEFLDEAGYLAYLKADAAGLVRIHAPGLVAAATPAPAAPPARPAVSLFAGRACVPGFDKNGEWQTCPGFPDLVIRRT